LSKTLNSLVCIDPEEQRDRLMAFYESLESERETFQLPLESILKSHLLYVVEDESGQIKALAGLRKKCCLSVFFVVVKEEFQGHGMGKQLTKTCFNALNLWNPIVLTVERHNKKAQRLYETLGMHVISANQHRVVMLKALGPLNWFMRFFLFWPKLRRD
jgi:ribosomal protein S18 acetylase RimI-like enzyme